jgi:hypothetical protein
MNITFYLDNGDLIVEPKEKLSQALLEEIEKHQPEIIDYLKMESFAKKVRSKSQKPVTFTELHEIDIPELQIVEGDLWFNTANAFDSQGTKSLTDEQIEERISLVKTLFPRCQIVQLKKFSEQSKDKKSEAKFQYQHDTPRYHRYKLEVGEGIIGFIYVPKKSEKRKK